MPKVKPAFEAYGVTDFCQDIRNEVGNTATLVGVFLSDIQLPSFPIIIPKLGFATTLIIPEAYGGGTSHRVRVKIFFPGDDLDRPTVDTESELPIPDRNSSGPERDKDIPAHAKIVQHVIVSPAQIRQPGFLKVRVEIDGRAIKAGVLRVVQGAQIISQGNMLIPAVSDSVTPPLPPSSP